MRYGARRDTYLCERLTHNDAAAGILPQGYKYTLPTASQYDIFVDNAALDDSVTSLDTMRKSTEEVGSKGANSYGLYDTRGNVYEWCEDWYRADMNSNEFRSKHSDLNVDGGGQKYKVMRGASWGANNESVALSYHAPLLPDKRSYFIGFRCVLVNSTNGTASPSPPKTAQVNAEGSPVSAK